VAIKKERLPTPVKVEPLFEVKPLKVKLEPPPHSPASTPGRACEVDDDCWLQEVEAEQVGTVWVSSDDEHVEVAKGEKIVFVKPDPKKRPKSAKVALESDDGLPKDMTLKFYSVGWFHMGSKYTYKFTDLCTDLQFRLSVKYAGLDDMALMIDARCFHMKPYSDHCGLFDDDIRRFVDNFHFKPWLQEVKAIIKDMQLQTPKEYLICKVCKAGHNRSVTAVMILRNVMAADGYVTKVPVHLSKKGWVDRKRICSTCIRCITDTPMKKEALSKAFRIWQSL
jgi:hypothetical protein